MTVPSDYTIIGTVLALAVAILALSGLALYVAFRVRETLRDEKGGSTRAVKVAFLIGLLFLSGGVFYFFATGFAASGGSMSILSTSTVSSSTGSAATSTLSSSTGAGPTATTTSGQSSTTTSTPTSTITAIAQEVSVPSPSCAGDRVTAGSTFSCSVYIYDSGSVTYSSATLISSGDLAKFTFLSCNESVNGGSPTPVSCSGGAVAVGNIVPNTIVLTLTVQAPSQSGQNSNCVLTLSANGLQPITVTFGIQVAA